MELSLNIILDHLRDLPLEVHVAEGDAVSFRRASMLPRDFREMQEDLIHICRLSDAIYASSTTPGMWYLCIRDRIRDESEQEDDLQRMIVVNKNMDVEELMDRIQELFDQISTWYMQMQVALIHEQSLQDIIDLSCSVIGNTINVTDSAFSVLARTHTIETDDEMSLQLEKNGYHSEEALQLFRQYHRFEVWTQSTDQFIINDSHDFCKYTLVSKVYRFRNTYFAHLVMVCDHHPLTDGLLELFGMLADIIAIHAERNWNDKSALSHNYDSFLVDLLNGTLTNSATIEDRANYLNFPTGGQLQLLSVAVADNMESSLGRVGRDLTNLLPGSQAVYYKHSICVLMHLYSGSLGVPIENLTHLLETHSAHGGLSNVFTGLDYLPQAYSQASLALKYNAQSPDMSQQYKLTSRLCSFQSQVLHSLLGEHQENLNIWQWSSYFRGLRILYDYDNQHSTNNLVLLRSYLYHERKATETGQEMHMHRNNVIYRIERIEKMTGFDLDDYDVRTGLSMSFILLEMYGLSSLDENDASLTESTEPLS